MHLNQGGCVLEHVFDECDKVEARECFGVTLVVFDQSPASCCPGEGSLHHPASGQQHKAAFSFWQLDDVQGDPFGFRGLGYSFASVALIDKRHGNVVSRCLLNVRGKAGNRRAVPDIGRRHVQCEQVAQRVDRQVHLRPALAFSGS